jgi:glutamine synthetase
MGEDDLIGVTPVHCETPADVMKVVADRKVSFIQFWFTDVLGVPKSFALTPSELDEGLTEGMSFDGSSIQGFARIQESDMIAKPDPTTFALVPWRGRDRPVARMLCDILNPDGTPYERDPHAAILETEKSKLVREVLGGHIFNKFIENKKIEWDHYRTHVSPFEIERYLPRL